MSGEARIRWAQDSPGPLAPAPDAGAVAEATKAVSSSAPVLQRASSDARRDTAPAGEIDEEVVQYAQWLTTHSKQSASLDAKLTAISKRTQAELKKAERTSGDHTQRLIALEEFCFQHHPERMVELQETHTKQLDEAVVRLRARLDAESVRVAEEIEALQTRQLNSEAEANEMSQGIKVLRRRLDAESEAMKVVNSALDVLREEQDRAAEALGECSSRADLQALSEEVHLYVAQDMANIRKMAQDRIAFGCSEMRGRLDEFRDDLASMRALLEKKDADLRRIQEELEVQVADVGSSLAVKLQARIAASARGVDERLDEVQERIEGRLDTAELALDKLPAWRVEISDVQDGFARIQETVHRELERGRELARSEAQSVHLEVMSVDMRVAALEERLADPSFINAQLRAASKRSVGSVSMKESARYTSKATTSVLDDCEVYSTYARSIKDL